MSEFKLKTLTYISGYVVKMLMRNFAHQGNCSTVFQYWDHHLGDLKNEKTCGKLVKKKLSKLIPFINQRCMLRYNPQPNIFEDFYRVSDANEWKLMNEWIAGKIKWRNPNLRKKRKPVCQAIKRIFFCLWISVVVEGATSFPPPPATGSHCFLWDCGGL